MNKMNWGRIIVCGLLAGFLFDVLEMTLSGLVVGEMWQREYAVLGRTMQPTPAFMAFMFSWGLVIGLVSIWLYAAIRPRYGPGPATALRASLALWLLYGLMAHVANSFMFQFSMKLMLTESALLLVFQIATTMVGAWLYKE